MKEIPLTQNKCAIIDDEDFNKIASQKWWLSSQGYAEGTDQETRKKILMHRLILGVKPGMTTDHINGNKLDNRRENLRHATYQQNNWNVTKRKNKSGFKGVYWCKHIKRWKASIGYNKKLIHIGCFDTPEDAARAYDEASKKYFKEYSKPNFEG